MLRVIALVATIAAAGTLTGTASAHPPDLYGSIYDNAAYGGGYATPAYRQHSYVQPRYRRPEYIKPTYGNPHAYVSPTYSATASAPAYSGHGYRAPIYDATPLYSKTYATPTYKPPTYKPTRRGYSGYRMPSYGYRHKRGGYMGGQYRAIPAIPPGY